MASSINRLQGRYAICQIGNTNATLFLVDWRIEVRTDFVDGTAFGDFWDVPVPIRYRWTGRARGRYSSQLSYLSAYSAQASTASGFPQDIVAANFSCYTDDSASHLIFQGPGYVELASFTAPEAAMVEQEINMRGYGPAAVVR